MMPIGYREREKVHKETVGVAGTIWGRPAELRNRTDVRTVVRIEKDPSCESFSCSAPGLKQKQIYPTLTHSVCGILLKLGPGCSDVSHSTLVICLVAAFTQAREKPQLQNMRPSLGAAEKGAAAQANRSCC